MPVTYEIDSSRHLVRTLAWLNGAPARFRITAVDGGQPGRADAIADAFRIEL
jgi:hypothetical protein